MGRCKMGECQLDKNICCKECSDNSCTSECYEKNSDIDCNECKDYVTDEEKCGVCGYESTITRFTAHYYNGETFETSKFKFCPVCGKEI